MSGGCTNRSVAVFRAMVAGLLWLGTAGAYSGQEYQASLLLGKGTAVARELTAGPVEADLELGKSSFFGLSISRPVDDHWAAGVEFGYDRSELNKLGPLPVSGDLAVGSLSVNGEYRFRGSNRGPFIGTGLGLAWVTAAPQAGKIILKDDGPFPLVQIAAGVRYQVSNSFSLLGQLRYRYFDGKLRLAEDLDASFPHDRLMLLIGANFHF